MARTKNTPNDPYRRERIMDATMSLLHDEGLGGLTARKVASHAQVPVGSVSYYFPSLRALLLEASRRVADLRTHALADWSATLTRDTLIQSLAEQIHRQITTGRGLTIIAYELYVVGLRDPEFRSISESVSTALRDAIAAHLDPGQAAHLAATAEGLQLRALVAPTPPETAQLRQVLTGP